MRGDVEKYQLAWIGRSVETDFASITLTPDQIVSCRGEIGDFTLTCQIEQQEEKVKVSNIIINLPYQQELAEKGWFSLLSEDYTISEDEPVIILQDYPDLSAAVMSQAGLKRALEIKADHPEKEVYYLYQAMRFMEDNDHLYERARESNVVFLKFDLGQLEIEDEVVRYTREDIDLKLRGDILAAPELKPPAAGKRLARIFNLAEGYQDYLQLDNVYLQPTLSGKRGVYLLGGSRGPTALTYYQEELEFTLAEVARNLEGVEPLDDQQREVDDQKCIVCYTCYRVCPHGAIQRDEELNSMQVMELACQGCNLCISRCPAGAITAKDELLQVKSGGSKGTRVIICENSAEMAAESYAQTEGIDLFSDYQAMVVPCVSTVKRDEIFSLLTSGPEDVLVLGCVAEACKHLTGHDRCQQVIDRIKEDLKKLDLEPERLQYQRLSPRMAADLAGLLSERKGVISS
ncbi:MAG: hydrogenase iron-sulfur subunit [Bacillota bacterium]